MDRAQEELQFLNSGGVFKQSFTLIFKWKKIFSQITLALIVPLFLIVLARSHFSHMFLDRHLNHQTDDDSAGQIVKKSVPLIIFQFVYVTFLIIFSLLSTSAVVYTIAYIYAAKEITLKKVMGVVPRVWKRLFLTFIVGYAILFLYFLVGVVLLGLILVLTGVSAVGLALFCGLTVLLISGLIYIYMIWNLASVVSVLEQAKGIKAIKKGKSLIKGHLGVSILLFVFQLLALGGTSVLYEAIVVFDFGGLNLAIKILIGILCFVLMVSVYLLVLVIQTVIYFVCKSYHHENIDRTSLADHLEASYGAYVRLNGAKDVQLQPLEAV